MQFHLENMTCFGCARSVTKATLLKLTDVAALPWHEQPERVFD